MPIILDIFKLFALFTFLGISADLVVRNIKHIAAVLRIRLFAFGILLGLVTTLPELTVGINATLEGVAGLSVGNLLGGIIVLFGLVVGSSLILNRKISTDGNLKTLIPEIGIMFSLVLLGLDGKFGLLDGLLMISLYFGLVYYLYRVNHSFAGGGVVMVEKNKIIKAISLAVIGVVFLLLVSHWIVDASLELLEYWNVSRLVMGFLIFSIGTNLPEISIAITSWRKKNSELSLSHILSSAFTNVLAMGMLAAIKPMSFSAGPAFYILSIFLAVILILFLFFYHSGKKMDRKEGVILLACYALFLLVNFWLIK